MRNIENFLTLPPRDQIGLINSRSREIGIPAPGKVAVLGQVMFERSLPVMARASVTAARLRLFSPSTDPEEQKARIDHMNDLTGIQRIQYVAGTTGNLLVALQEGVRDGNYNLHDFRRRQQLLARVSDVHADAVIPHGKTHVWLDPELWRVMFDAAAEDKTYAIFFDPENSILPNELHGFIRDNPHLSDEIPEFIESFYKPLASAVVKEEGDGVLQQVCDLVNSPEFSSVFADVSSEREEEKRTYEEELRRFINGLDI